MGTMAHDPHHQHHFTTMEQQFDTSKIGMWLFLATEILLFGGLFVGFGMMQARYPQEFVEAHEHLQRWLGALNTVVLLILQLHHGDGGGRGQAAARSKKTVMYLVHHHSLRLHLPGGEVLRVLAQVRRRPAARALLLCTADRAIAHRREATATRRSSRSTS